MQRLLRIVFVAFIIVVCVTLHIGSAYVLPFPYSQVHILAALLILGMLWRESGVVVWIAFFSYLLIELYTITPFGIVLFSGTISMLCTYWLYVYIVANRSWYAALILSLFMTLLYRTLYFFTLTAVQIAQGSAGTPWRALWISFFWEMLFTSILATVVFAVLLQVSTRLNPRFIRR